MNSVDELKQRLIDVWNSLQQNVIDVVINDWRKQLRTCVHADGQHFEHLLRARVTDKRCVYVCMYVSFGQGSSLHWTHTLRPFYSRPIALTQEGSLVNDVCECVRD